ncbi:MAG: HAD family phosphatase [Spirochaetales bacterium]|nr:HAD family phosphatase [Spirochaetales bacterium]
MSIKNIIFDLGGVVFNWQPSLLLSSLFNNKKIEDTIVENLLKQSDWEKLDQGVLSREDAIKNSILRSGLEREYFETFFNHIPEALSLIQDTVDIIYNLKQKGYNLFVLSNMHIEFAKYLISEYNFWDQFNDIVFSCDVKMIKPNTNIYQLLLERNNLNPNQCLFIDDTKINLDTAENLGITTIQFTNSADLKEKLSKLNI